MDSKKARSAYPKLFEEIRGVVYRHDPSGLFSLGAPKDEHDDDVHRIISRLQHVHDSDEVPNVLEDIMGSWFADNPSTEDFPKVMAPAIWDAWRAFREKAE